VVAAQRWDETPAPYTGGAVELETILKEKDACGVGFIASLRQERKHKIVTDALMALGCMEHRGGCSADNDSGDGAGIMCEVPWKVINAWCAANGKQALEEGKSAVGMVFLPRAEGAAAEAKAAMESSIEAEGLTVVGWRPVPTNDDVVGIMAKETQPIIEQVLVAAPEGMAEADLDRALFLGRKSAEQKASASAALADDFYVCTLSARTIVYKGMLRSAVVGEFYLDLQDPDFETQFAIYHRRFSTNTTPKWPLAQPMRFLGHNGEINTLQGNLNWVASKQGQFTHPVWEGEQEKLEPLCSPAVSDSANLDRLAELRVKTGFSVEQTMMMLVPEAYRNHPTLDATYPEATAFYDFFGGMQEAWDGPALLVFSDGKKIGARLDRNGLRPARFWRTSDDTIYVASEVGVLGDVISNAENVVAKGRLGPGLMVLADLQTGTFKENTEIAKEVCTAEPYAEWVKQIETVEGGKPLEELLYAPEKLLALQASAGYTAEDVAMIIEGMAAEGKEPTFSMGDDTPMAPLSGRHHPLYDYFKQRFAQVTNPPIDPLREGLVMSLEMRLGKRGNLLQYGADDAKQVLVKSPVLLESELDSIMSVGHLKPTKLPTFFDAGKAGGLEEALAKLCAEAEAAVEAGSEILVLTDKTDSPESGRPAIQSLLAVGALHHHLITKRLRSKCSIVVESSSAFSTHHIAVLVGYGASAVCPWLAFETARAWTASSRTQNLMKRGKIPQIAMSDAQINIKRALNGGLKKILSKMGISLLSSYHGAQIFECYGLGEEVIDRAFKGSVSRIGGLNMDEVAKETEMAWSTGFPASEKLLPAGFFQAKPGLEYHGNNTEMSKLLHKSVGLGGNAPSDDAYELYMQHRNGRPATALRDMLEISSDRQPIDISEVESAADICERFCTGGMSLGAISRECHEVIALAMNRIGGKSNSGEGGEDPVRFVPLEDVDGEGNSDTFPYLKKLQNGDVASSAIKQVASGRFGVTPEFLAVADQLEIKVAQGAKPGEGGQLPGKKVSPYIAGLRRSKAGVPLISPPPHHDIYSIEDLAQLIFDLHQINKNAKVSVKLVGQAGIGTVASGVAKANADVIQISGHDGGTGASPISSIKHCGGPLEMGLMESHRTLLENGLRDRVVLRADGGLKSGMDVIQTALMGADEYGFGTVAMIATGCVMARVCHTNNCPVGVASQREELRARFPGTPSDVVNFFIYVAEEVRQTLASMGYKSLDEIIGRVDLLKQRAEPLPKTANLDLSFLTTYIGDSAKSSSERLAQQTHSNGPMLDDDVLADPAVMAAIEGEGNVEKSYGIVNTDRTACARIAGEIAKRHGDYSFAGNIALNLEGSAGQSFAAFTTKGMTVKLVGEGNDYVCKGMAGGVVSIQPPPGSPFNAEDATIAGNTCLYGATGGQLFLNGRAGERFAVRNSMAETVVEGTGDHCCEYMTGGVVVSLGKVGRNVGAGMTGGLGYFLDEDGSFLDKVNGEIVSCQRVETQAGETQLQRLLQEHVARTGSAKAQAVLDNWEAMLPKFWQVVPPSEANTPEVTNEVAEVAASA